MLSPTSKMALGSLDVLILWRYSINPLLPKWESRYLCLRRPWEGTAQRCIATGTSQLICRQPQEAIYFYHPTRGSSPCLMTPGVFPCRRSSGETGIHIGPLDLKILQVYLTSEVGDRLLIVGLRTGLPGRPHARANVSPRGIKCEYLSIDQ